MRTTLELPDPLFRTLKARAAIEGMPMKQLLQRLIESGLAGATPSSHAQVRQPFPSISTGAPLTGPFSNAALFELLDDEDTDSKQP